MYEWRGGEQPYTVGLGFVAALAGPVKPRGCFEGVDAFRVSGDLTGPKSWQAMIDSVGEKIYEEMCMMIEGESQIMRIMASRTMRSSRSSFLSGRVAAWAAS